MTQAAGCEVFKEDVMDGGHSACPGCGSTVALRMAMAALGKRCVLFVPASCGTLYFGIERGTVDAAAINTVYASPFGQAAGYSAALRQKGDHDTQVIVWGGDGAFHDMAMDGFSHVASQNYDLIAICNDNQGYMNTGGQTSSATPKGVKTRLSPDGYNVHAKNLVEIMAAHRIPYAATVCAAFPDDLRRKVEKAKTMRGMRFIHLLTSCVKWGHASDAGVRLARQAVNSGLHPLYEVFDGAEWVINHNPAARIPGSSMPTWANVSARRTADGTNYGFERAAPSDRPEPANACTPGPIDSPQMNAVDKIFPEDSMRKRERVVATLRHQPVDRVALLEQLSYNPGVIASLIGKTIHGFDYTVDDVCAAIGSALDLTMPPIAPRGTNTVADADGFVVKRDNWTTWRVSRPFGDAEGAREWLGRRTTGITDAAFDAGAVRSEYRDRMGTLQARIGGTVILDYSQTGFCAAYDAMGLEIFAFFVEDYPDAFGSYIEASTAREIERVHAVADAGLSPVILIPEDFAAKHGPIFSPAFLREHHFPYVARLVDAWHEHGLDVIYHSDGNYRECVPDLMAAGVDGFYCLEPACGMDIVELKNRWPEMVWAGGVDGVDLMERGTPDQVHAEVTRQIVETDALGTGGMFVASSSEINPPIPADNFAAMVGAVGRMRNPAF